ncbi:MAG: DUF3558 domain-containing protein [Pseudonocardiales bacterium]|nr:DUF3558 domain-containing protein [Pseudonocardiales bacterium]
MRGLVVLLIGGLAVACAAPVPVPPTPAATTAAAPTSAPARPREIRLDGVDPCTLLTPAQRKSLGLAATSQPYTAGRPTPGSACSITGFEPRAINVGLTTATTVGITDITAPGAVSDRLTPIVVARFPAVISQPRNPDLCFVDIDIATGQLLDVLFRDGGGAVPIPQDDLCRGAVDVASRAMTTLLAR